MKKILLSLLIFCSVILQAQIQIPQVVGLTSALNSKVDKVTGKSLVADTSIIKLNGIQSGAQVNILEGVQRNGANLTITGKKVNITVPTTAAEIGAQPAGTYATGNGTANGTNTGDETLTSIKTKLGAASLINSGYLTNTDWSAFYAKQNSLVFGNLTTSTNGVSITNGAGAIIGTGTAVNITTASASSGGLLSTTDWNNFNNKQPSGSYEPAFSKNTAFNKNFGTTTGTVLEGRTFGTAAGSSVGDFVQNQNLSAQSSNLWISGSGRFGNDVSLNGGTGTRTLSIETNTSGNPVLSLIAAGSDAGSIFYNRSTSELTFSNSSTPAALKIGNAGVATFSSTVNSTGFLLNGNNLTSSLTTNYIPKWNGSSFVNSLISDDGTSMTLNGYITGTTGIRLNRSGYNTFQMAIDETGLFMYDVTRGQYLITFKGDDGRAYIPSTTPSTTPTTGALVVNGGIGADHVRANNFYGNGSNLTGVQRQITLTTNGTSGAATLSGNVMNVPNYAASGGVNQTQTTVNGSTSGAIVCSMPFQTGSYKKVMIRINSLNGSVSYTFPTSFQYPPTQQLSFTNSLSVTGMSETSISFSSTNGATGWIILEGY